MKGKIDLKDFILGVKEELVQASKEGSQKPFFELTEVEMEASFSLEASAEAKGGFKFLVSIQGGTNAEQSHTVTLKFKPIPTRNNSIEASEGPNYRLVIDNPVTSFINRMNQSSGMPQFVEPNGFSVVGPTGPLFQTPTREYLEHLMQEGIISNYNIGANESEE